ncbi:MAG TPA: ABC transporter substrate-binding protein [Bacillales bacterium]|nr:ABC transporter substrate-binding protein [Bacillales bacterium]
MKKRGSILFILLLTFLLAACSSQPGGQTAKDHQTAKQEQNTGQKDQQQKAFPVTFTDAVGNKVTIKHKPKRIVSLVPSNTEIAFALGAGDRIVAVDKFSDYPKQAKKLPKVGGQNFNVEKIISLKPDVVLAWASQAKNKKAGLDQLRHAGIKVVIVNQSYSFEDVYKSIHMIAKATGTTDKAQKVIGGMKQKFARIKKKASKIPKKDRVSVWVEVSPPPNIYTTGKGTFMDQMLDLIHAKNIVQKKGWVKYSPEAAVKRQPDVIVVTYGYQGKNTVKKVLHRDGWQQVPAIQNKRVYSVNPDIVSVPGPRLVKGVEQLARVIYPDVFKK